MKKHIVCLGDSNTHGYCADPQDCADPVLARFNEEERWTKLLPWGRTIWLWRRVCPAGPPYFRTRFTRVWTR